MENMEMGIMVSVALPVYNGEKYLGEAIESILNQTLRNIELLIIDDGSTDKTLEIIQRYAKLDSRIKYRSRENKGLSKTLNELLQMAKGKYIARMDHDDISEPDRFQIQYDYMERHHEIVALGTACRIIGTNRVDFLNNYGSIERREIRLLFYNSGLCHPSAMLRKKFLQSKNIWYNEKSASEDYELWCKIVMNGGHIDSLDLPLHNYRVYEGQVTDRNREKIQKADEDIRLYMLSQFGEFSEREKYVFLKFGKIYKTEDLEEFYGIIDKLVACNKSKKVFNEHEFILELQFQLLVKILLEWKYTKNAKILFSKSNLCMLKPQNFWYNITQLLMLKKGITKLEIEKENR